MDKGVIIMRTRIILSKIRLCAVILLTSFSFVTAESVTNNTAITFSPVSPDDIPDILTMISAQVRSNYEHIKTWQGKIDSTVAVIYEGPAAERVFKNKTDSVGKIPKAVREYSERTVRFAVDCEKNFFYAKKYRQNPRQYTDLKSGRNFVTKSLSTYEVVISTPEYYIYSRPDRRMRGGGPIVRRSAVKKEAQECSRSEMAGVFDPRRCFIPGSPIWETFPRVVQYINEHGNFSVDGHALKVEERMSGTITEYRIQLPGKLSPGNYLFMTMVFSSDKRFNITSLETTISDGQLFQKMTWDYGLVDGLYLPNKTTKQDFSGENAKLSYDKRSFFKNSKINRPIPAKTFTYKNLGLENGDRFVDKILHKDYFYQNRELIPIVKKK